VDCPAEGSWAVFPTQRSPRSKREEYDYPSSHAMRRAPPLKMVPKFLPRILSFDAVRSADVTEAQSASVKSKSQYVVYTASQTSNIMLNVLFLPFLCEFKCLYSPARLRHDTFPLRGSESLSCFGLRTTSPWRGLRCCANSMCVV